MGFTDYFEILNCQDDLNCPKNWHLMDKTGDSEIKVCQQCGHNVRFVRSKVQALQLSDSKHRIAFYEFSNLAAPNKPTNRAPTITSGIPMPKRSNLDLKQISRINLEIKMIRYLFKFILLVIGLALVYGLYLVIKIN